MIAANSPRRLMFGQSRIVSRIKSAGSPRTAALLILFGLLATTIYLPSSASVSRLSSFAGVRIGVGGATKGLAVKGDLGIPAIGGSYGVRGLMALAMPQAGPESIVVSPPATRADGCNNPDILCLGETVTATVSNAPLAGENGFRQRRIQWVAPDGSVPQLVDVVTDPQTDTYMLPTEGSFAQVGTWQVRTITNRFGAIAVTTFEVGDPSKPSTDLAISVTGPTSVTANTNATYTVTITNNGPDTADNVTLFNPVPYNSTFFSASGPESFPCTTPTAGEVGDINCSTASLALNASAAFTFVFSVNSDVKNGSAVYEWAKTETSTNEPDQSNNISDIYASSTPPGGGGGSCTLDCPEDVNAVADTTEGTQRGAHVSFPPTTTAGDCGTVTTSPASGDFFPVGNTTVTSTSQLNGGSCTFVVTVEDQGTNPPTISCPTNKTANADSSTCFVAVSVGTATATGNNVTVTATRSDGKAMYTCDENGTNCTRVNPDDLFPPGITTITWIAHSHDTAGPYADAADEEAHRTGAASCTQTVTVNDVTPPTITPPPNQTASADGNCMAAVPDFTTSATVADNCACDSNTADCQGRVTITVTQSPAPGTMVGLGDHDITLTANDGSSNPNAGPDGIPGTSDDGTGNIATAHLTFTVKDTTPPVIHCPANITTNTDPGLCSAVVDPGTATATDNCDTSVTITGTRSDNQPLNAPYPKGTTTITWTAKDDATPANESSCQQTVKVEDHEPPVITTNGVTPMLWPANHNYHTYTASDFVTAVTDNCDSLGVGDVVIQKVTSDETENGGGDGNTFNDIIIAADCKSVQVRAERRNSADGRVYTITFKVTDSSGNVTTKTATVEVPKNLGVPVVNSGPNYTVTSNCP